MGSFQWNAEFVEKWGFVHEFMVVSGYERPQTILKKKLQSFSENLPGVVYEYLVIPQVGR
jgi:hypothetical protein